MAHYIRWSFVVGVGPSFEEFAVSRPYPPARKSDLIETLHGVSVPDPYRWLEDAASAETKAWVEAQNALTRSVLDGAAREGHVQRLKTLFNVPRSAEPLRRGERYFVTVNPGLLDQSMLFVRHGADGEPRIVLDPNALSADGTVALTGIFPSDDGALLLYGLSRSGSDRQELAVRDVSSGRDLDDRIAWVKFASVGWLPDGSGFYYLRFPEPGSVPPEEEQYHGTIWFHRIGTPQSADDRIFAAADKDVVPLVDVTRDARFVVITCQRGASDDSEIYLIDRASNAAPAPLFAGFDAAYAFIGSDGDRLLFRTTRDAPMGRIIGVATGGTITTVVPENADRLADAVIARGTIAVAYLHNASSDLRLFDLSGDARGAVALPGIGTIVTLDADADGPDVLFAFTSFTQESTAYRYDTVTGAMQEVLRQPPAVRLDPEAYETRQIWYPSKDGTRVSMFLVQRRNLAPDGHRPVLLSGYGGFNISRTPLFDPLIVSWLDEGGLFALPNLRGGGEYGDAWHQAGMLDRKQNVFDDFIAAAEHLIAGGWTDAPHIAIHGGSNGGLLVGAVMVQRPDLFGAVISRVPVADMLRYHLFTVGRFWIPEYGCADDPLQFPVLFAYSPYHNVRDTVAYPATLVMTADTDDRVSPGMAKKFAARLQAASTRGPILIRVETKAGHGLGKPVSKVIEEDADILSFLEVAGVLPLPGFSQETRSSGERPSSQEVTRSGEP
jgi:prolyl oligopeptidase